jgi:hypothetical protein
MLCSANIGVAGEQLEEAVLDHHAGAAHALFGRLEDQVQRAIEGRVVAARWRAAPSRMAVWPSWPQACILPSRRLAQGSWLPVRLEDRQGVHVGADADARVLAVAASSGCPPRRSCPGRGAPRSPSAAGVRPPGRWWPVPRNPARGWHGWRGAWRASRRRWRGWRRAQAGRCGHSWRWRPGCGRWRWQRADCRPLRAPARAAARCWRAGPPNQG